ncbi:unnamed protein product, partial [Rotaria socialis]
IKTHDASSLIQNAPLVDLLNPSNINDLPENYDESENESEFFGNFDKSPNTNKQISPQQTTNLSLSNRSTQIEIVSSKADMHCCNSSKPYHPVTDDELAFTTIDKRACQKWWFMDHSWLTFLLKKVFCHTCRDAFEREIHPNKTKFNPAYRRFITDGFCDWKNARERFKYHESSKIHSDSIYVINQQTKPTVIAQLISRTKRQQEQHRESLLIQISSLIYLLRQGRAFRGHSDIESNLIQLLKLRSTDNNFLKEWINNKKYLSHDIINDLCREIYLFIIRDIVKEISNRKCFSLTWDETCDESTLEQLCFGIRSVNDNYEIFEDVLGLYELSRQNAEAIVEVIFDILTRCRLNISDCRGQSYDGASSMSGIYGGVSALVLKQQFKAFFVHCNAHCLDLAVHDLTNECPTISNCILFAKDIIDFVRLSSKHLSILKEISNQLSMPYSNLASLCPTRWTRRAESYNSLLNNYELVQEALYTLIEEKGGPGIKANGLHEQMNKFYFFFGLKLGYLLFSATEKLSRIIQSSSCCLQDVLSSAESVILYFERIRDDINFKSFYTKVLKESKSLTDKLILARHRRPPKRYQSSSDSVEFSSYEEFYRQQYMKSLGIVVNMLQNRFTQKNFKLLCNVEKFIFYAENNSLDDSNDYFQSIMDFYYGDIDVEKLKVEALMIVDFYQSVIKTNQMNIKQITKISTIRKIFNSCEVGKEMFKEYQKLIKLYLTIPVTTATAERTISTLNRLKTAIRSTMTQSCLNLCLLLHIYKEKIDKIDPRQIASKFISSSEKRQHFFGLML